VVGVVGLAWAQAQFIRSQRAFLAQ